MKIFTKILSFVFVIAIAITSIVKAELTPAELVLWYTVNDVVYAGGPSVLAGTDGGLLRSGNHGISFYTTDIHIRVVCLDYDATSNIVYIGTVQGLYYGPPNASSFTKATGLGNNVVKDIAVVGEGIVSGKNRIIISYGGVVAYKSDDNGLSWSLLSLEQGYSYKLEYGGIINGNKVVFASNNKVYRNDNNGDGVWINMYNSYPNHNINGMSFSIVSSSIPRLYFVQTHLTYGMGEIWEFSYSYTFNDWKNEQLILNIPYQFFAGPLFSDELNNVRAGTKIVGIIKPSGGANSFSYDWNGSNNRNIQSIKSSPSYLFACTYGGGIYYRPLPVNSSGTWTQSTIIEWTRPSINTLEAQAVPFYQFASLGYYGIFRSTNQGTNWNLSNSGLTNLNVEQTISQNNTVFAATHGGVHKSTNYGTSWILWNNGITDSVINCFAKTSSIIFAGTDSKGVFRSTNDTLVWVTAGLSNKKIRKLFVTGNFVFAATNSGVYKTSNSGAVWETPSLSDTAINGFAVRGSSLYAVSGNNGVFVSTNNGTNWSTFNSGLTSTSINTILSNNNILYVGTKDSGLFNASAGNWESTNRNAGIFSLNITALAADSNNIYVGDNCGLVYSGPFSSIVNIENKNNETPSDYNLSQNYPNPFNPVTKIKFGIPKSSFVNLAVYDILGREVAKLVNDKLNSGTYLVDWNASQYPSGVYFYRLQSGDFVDVKKMLMIK